MHTASTLSPVPFGRRSTAVLPVKANRQGVRPATPWPLAYVFAVFSSFLRVGQGSNRQAPLLILPASDHITVFMRPAMA